MPKKRRKTVRKGLRFTVPLIRLVMPLDSPDAIQKSPSIRPHTLLRLVGIETPLEALLPNRPKAPPAPPPTADPTLPKPAPKKRSKKTSTSSRANDGRASPRRRNK